MAERWTYSDEPTPLPVMTRDGAVVGLNPLDRPLITACPADTPPADHPWTVRVQVRDTILEVGWLDSEWAAEVSRRDILRSLRDRVLDTQRDRVRSRR
jgi:hypothetical protein